MRAFVIQEIVIYHTNCYANTWPHSCWVNSDNSFIYNWCFKSNDIRF